MRIKIDIKKWNQIIRDGIEKENNQEKYKKKNK